MVRADSHITPASSSSTITVAHSIKPILVLYLIDMYCWQRWYFNKESEMSHQSNKNRPDSYIIQLLLLLEIVNNLLEMFV